MSNNVYATFSNPDMAKKAVGALLDNGIRNEHISIVFPEGYKSWETGDKTTGSDVEKSAESGITTTTGADAGAGAAKGAGFGLAAGALAALASVFIPGVGLVIGGGALAIAMGGLAGATAAGAVAGGATGFLKDQGASEETIRTYDAVLRAGGAFVSVTPTDEKVYTATIEDLLVKYDGVLSSGRATVVTGRI